MTWVIY